MRESIPDTVGFLSRDFGWKDAATVYRQSERPPKLNKDSVNVLEYVKDDQWVLKASVGDADERHYAYRTSDLRMSVVYRARCFADGAESKRFAGVGGPEMIPLDDILKSFADDLVRRGHLKRSRDAFDMPRLEFAMKIIDTYITYPYSQDFFIPYNYCAIGRLSPLLGALLRPLCG